MDRKHNKEITSVARQLRKKMTKEERHLWYDFLRFYPVRFYRQKVLGHYIADFYCAQAKLVLELDGSQHFEEKGVCRDTQRTGYLEGYDLLVVRIPNNEVNGSFREVCEYVDLLVRQRMHERDILSGQENTVHSMKLKPFPFEMIKKGQKTIELRLFDEKRQKIKVEDTIVFTNSATEEMLSAKVVKLHSFNSFGELYRALPLLQCGYTSENIDKATPADMEQYYSVEEQRKYGVVGIKLILIDETEHP